MFERFDERARQVVVLAQDEARGLGHDYIGTEHILLGLLREEEGLAADVLGALDVTLEEARAQVVQIVGRAGGEAVTGQIPFTPRAKHVLELSLREAMSLGRAHIGTEHILLGLVCEQGVATRILLDFDLDGQTIRREVVRRLSGRSRGSTRWSGAGRGPTPGLRPGPVEYRIERPEPGFTAEWLNALGGEGWRLTGVVSEPDGAALIFQRPAPG